jgi:hypothetical protein
MSEVFEMVQKIMDNLDNGGGTPEHLIMGPAMSEEGPASQERMSNLELRRSEDMKTGDGKWIMWPKWTPKLVRTH